MKHQIGGMGGNILVHTNCMDITMAWKTSCKDVATRVGSFALHIIFCLGLKWRPWQGTLTSTFNGLITTVAILILLAVVAFQICEIFRNSTTIRTYR